MTISDVFKTRTAPGSPLDGSRGNEPGTSVSEFLTVQSFANFAMMAGAIAAAWHALQRVMPGAASIWTPYVCAFAWGVISLLMSLDGLPKPPGEGKRPELGTLLAAVFVAFLNSLVLASAVVGTAR
jgi:hypothetical protein